MAAATGDIDRERALKILEGLIGEARERQLRAWEQYGTPELRLVAHDYRQQLHDSDPVVQRNRAQANIERWAKRCQTWREANQRDTEELGRVLRDQMRQEPDGVLAQAWKLLDPRNQRYVEEGANDPADWFMVQRAFYELFEQVKLVAELPLRRLAMVERLEAMSSRIARYRGQLRPGQLRALEMDLATANAYQLTEIQDVCYLIDLLADRAIQDQNEPLRPLMPRRSGKPEDFRHGGRKASQRGRRQR